MPDHGADQVPIAVLTHGPAQPQPGTHLDSHSQPQNDALRFHPNLIGLHLSQVPRLLDQVFMNRLTLLAGLLFQTAHRALIPLKSLHNRLHRATESQQGHDAGNHLGRLLAAIEDRPLGLHKCLIAHVAVVPLLFLTMNPDVVFTNLAACQTLRIGAKCGLRIHGFTLRIG